MRSQQAPDPAAGSSRTRPRRRLSLWLSLAFGVALALQGCSGLSGGSDQFRAVPSTGASGSTALAINLESHFLGHIAFVRNHQLYTLSGKDGAISALPAGAAVQDPAYSPDGSLLAYISRGADWSDLMVIPVRGGKPMALTQDQGKGQQTTCPSGISETDDVWAANPVWSPDGATIYYLSDRQKLLPSSCGFQDLAVWQVAARGGVPQLVLWPARGADATGMPGAGGDAHLSLRPREGHELTYTRYAYGAQPGAGLLAQVYLDMPSQQKEIALMPAVSADGTPQETLEASWSPDGQFLAYIVHANSFNGLAVMRVSDPANGAPQFGDYATSTQLLSGAITYPIWSPDGKALLYLDFKNNEYNLYLAQLSFNGTSVSLQGSPTQLTQGGMDGDWRPTWTGA